MAEFPSMPLWTDAYLGDTTHLTTLEHGAYLLLLMTAWRARDNKLPDDDKLLARYTKLGPAQWRRIKPIISEFFTIENGHWSQRRLNDEAIAVKQYRERQRNAGLASALKRKGRHSTTVQSGCNQTATPTPSPSPTVDTIVSTPPSPPKHIRMGDWPEIPDWIPVDEWNAFIEMRKRKGRGSPTERAISIIIRKLEKWKDEGEPPGAVLDQSTEGQWTGVFRLKDQDNGKQSNHPNSNQPDRRDGLTRAIQRRLDAGCSEQDGAPADGRTIEHGEGNIGQSLTGPSTE